VPRSEQFPHYIRFVFPNPREVHARAVSGERIRRLRAALATDQPKGYQLGTDRVCDPAETVDRVMPLATAAGVTRLAEVTRLDTVGVPVWCAIRPVSTNLSVSQGKGLSGDAARASAIMESLEMWHAEQHSIELTTATLNELRSADLPTVEVSRLERYSRPEGGPVDELDTDTPIRWTVGWDLIKQTAPFVPYEVVHCDGSLPLHPGEGVFQRGSNGLASGNNLTEAVLHALYEVVEREQQRQQVDWTARRIRLETLSDPDLLDIVEAFDRAGVDIGLYDATGTCGIATVIALGRTRDGVDIATINTVPHAFGAGAHLSRTIAASRALTELAQVRATVIAGSRDDIARPVYQDWAEEDAEVRSLLEIEPTVDFSTLPTSSNTHLSDDLSVVLAQLTGAGFEQVVVCDLSLDDSRNSAMLGDPAPVMSVVKVIVPGMRLEAEPGPPPKPMPDLPAGAPAGHIAPLDLDAVRRTGIAVFAGPTLPDGLGRDLIDAAWLPPAECGDIWRVVRAGAHTVIVIDGRYASVPAPWHKEFHWALARGVRVIGAGSIGALRAAELRSLGMIGVGQVVRLYTDRVISGDDEVAVAHADASSGWRQLNDALVDCRYHLSDAARQGVISDDDADAVLDALRATFYPLRSLADAARRALDAPSARAVIEHVRTLPRQKQLDALEALRLAATPAGAKSATGAPPFADTSAWGVVVRTEADWPVR
jgi:YcaO-like protein with predicted kinase domain